MSRIIKNYGIFMRKLMKMSKISIDRFAKWATTAVREVWKWGTSLKQTAQTAVNRRKTGWWSLFKWVVGFDDVIKGLMHCWCETVHVKNGEVDSNPQWMLKVECWTNRSTNGTLVLRCVVCFVNWCKTQYRYFSLRDACDIPLSTLTIDVRVGFKLG